MEEQNNQNFEKRELTQENKSENPKPKKAVSKKAIIIGVVVVAVVTIAVALVALLGGKDNGSSIPAHTHSFGEWEITKIATCSTEGGRNDTVPAVKSKLM